jgi:signal transduction histidine kinase
MTFATLLKSKFPVPRFGLATPRQMAVAIGTLLIVVLIATATVTIERSRRQQLDAAAHELSQLSLTLSEEAARTMQSVGLMLTDVQSRLDVAGAVTPGDFERYAKTKEFYQYLREKIRDVSHIDALVVVDRDGRIVNSTRGWPSEPVALDDRDYFKANRDSPGAVPFIGVPVHSRFTGDWVIEVARRISGPNGEFLGVVVSVMQIEYFQEFYRAVSEGSERTISLFRRDGVLLARHPESENQIGGFFGGRPIFSDTMAKADAGIVFTSASAFDDLARVMAPHAVHNFPLVVNVTDTENAILAPWRRIALVISGVTGAAIALILFLGVVLDRQLRLRSRIAETQADRQRAENARAAAELANKAKGDFLANMSHELRTPLNAIIGFAEMLQSYTFGALNSKQSEYVRDIRMSGRHLLGLINTVLDMSKIEAGQFDLHEELIEPGTIIDDAMTFLALQAKQRGVDLRQIIPDDLPLVLADRRAILQVLLNLLANAVNYTKAGGAVVLSADLTEAGVLQIVVSDTGIGIDPDSIDRIFEPFQSADASLSRKLGGAGLGLAVSKMLIERHGGVLILRSAIGKGTTVTVSLPAERVVGHKTLAPPVASPPLTRVTG